jgi:uncharacterized protein (TIGR02117 family)
MLRVRYFLLTFIVLVGCHQPRAELYPDDPSQRTIPVFIISHGWHTGIVIGEEYFTGLITEPNKIPRGNYLMFEWGDARYFPHDDPWIGLLLRAALVPTGSVVQITGLNNQPNIIFPHSTVVKIDITQEGISALSDFLLRQFQKNSDGQFIYVQKGLYPNSSFFKAERLYFFPRTSNTWTAHALRQTGYPITPALALTARNVMKVAAEYGEVLD